MKEVIVHCDNVKKTYVMGEEKVHALRGVSVDIERGEYVSIMGPSGSGKSTLFNMIGGLDTPTEGQVKVEGSSLSSLSSSQMAWFRCHKIGFIFQSFNLIPTMTALENVAVPLELSGKRNAFQKAEAELRSVGLGERLSHYPAQLSGGEQQRVAIARALAPDPKILVADEPTGNLDEETGSQIAELMFAQQKDRGSTLVLVTHDPALAARCDRTLRVRAGEIESDEHAASAA